MIHDAFWDRYARENESRYNVEFAKFTRDLATSLHCSSVLEIGCGTGIDLRLFPDTFDVYGIDPNYTALSIAREKMPNTRFEIGTIVDLPFGESEIDFVFTHQLLNYLDDQTLESGMSEMYRVARRYIMNCEKFSESETSIDEHHKYRDMRSRWSNYNVKIISNVNMHKEIESDEARFTLLKKL